MGKEKVDPFGQESLAVIQGILPELNPLDPGQRYWLIGKIQEEICRGLYRIEQGLPPTDEAGGLSASLFPVKRPSMADLWRCPQQPVLTCAYGGTQWRTTVLFWNGFSFAEMPGVESQMTIPENGREFKGEGAVNRFVGRMTGLAQESLRKYQSASFIQAAGISLAFPQDNEGMPYGVEGRLGSEILPKGFKVEGGKGIPLGRLFLADLQPRGYPNLQRIAIGNDAICVACDSTAGGRSGVLPLAVIIGSGANIAAELKEGQLVNLEIGQARSLGTDRILTRMHFGKSCREHLSLNSPRS